jgi:hypothetical protein
LKSISDKSCARLLVTALLANGTSVTRLCVQDRETVVEYLDIVSHSLLRDRRSTS